MLSLLLFARRLDWFRVFLFLSSFICVATSIQSSINQSQTIYINVNKCKIIRHLEMLMGEFFVVVVVVIRVGLR